jgi:hypothetical protein
MIVGLMIAVVVLPIVTWGMGYQLGRSAERRKLRAKICSIKSSTEQAVIIMKILDKLDH